VNLELRVLPSDDSIPVVEVFGDIDTANAADLRATLAQRASPGLVVDLSSVGYLDSAGFAVLDDLLSRTELAIVVSPASVIRAAVSLMDMPFHDTVEGARAAVQARGAHG
jgi:anti-sigma B factor antagonist